MWGNSRVLHYGFEKPFPQYDFQISSSWLLVLLLLVTQSYQWGRVARASWQLENCWRSQGSSIPPVCPPWEVSLGRYLFYCHLTKCLYKLTRSSNDLLLFHGDVLFRNGGHRFLLWKVMLISKCWYEGTNEFLFKQKVLCCCLPSQPCVWCQVSGH